MNWEYDDALSPPIAIPFQIHGPLHCREARLRAPSCPSPLPNSRNAATPCSVERQQESVRRPKGNWACPSWLQLPGGLLANALHWAISNPTVNSYKRINAPVTLSGAPGRQHHYLTGNTAPHDRIPEAGRSSCGCRTQRQSLSAAGGDPGGGLTASPASGSGKRLDINMYTAPTG